MSVRRSASLSSSYASALPRRASLALPFVMTAAAAACTPRQVEEPTTAPRQGEQEATPVIISNPPQPQPATGTDATGITPATNPTVAAPETGVAGPEPKPVIMRNPPPPGPGEVSDKPKIENVDPNTAGTRPVVAPELPKAPADFGVVRVRDDGSCWWQASVTCPPKTMCNPPPPKQVQCAGAKPVRRTPAK